MATHSLLPSPPALRVYLDTTETMVLREHAILTILTKLSRYESECAIFEKKYGASLESFRNQLEQKMNSESFMEEDDFLDWEYADSARNWWHLKMKELTRDHLLSV